MVAIIPGSKAKSCRADDVSRSMPESKPERDEREAKQSSPGRMLLGSCVLRALQYLEPLSAWLTLPSGNRFKICWFRRRIGRSPVEPPRETGIRLRRLPAILQTGFDGSMQPRMRKAR